MRPKDPSGTVVAGRSLQTGPRWGLGLPLSKIVALLAILIVFGTGCVQYAPYRAGLSGQPAAIVHAPDAPVDRYRIAFVEFGEDGISQLNSQLQNARNLIRDPKVSDPLVIVYIHGWQNNADSADVCRFEHFIDVLSRNQQISANHLQVIGVYLAWRGKSLNVDYLNTLTFWDREGDAHKVANAADPANPAFHTLSDAVDILGRDVREKKRLYVDRRTGPRAVLLGHSFGALVLEESITRDIQQAVNNGSGDSITWDLAVTLNSANDSQNSRQLLQTFDDLYRHEGDRYVSRTDPKKSFPDRRTALISVTSDTDDATGVAFPLGSWIGGFFKARLLRDDDISTAQTRSIAEISKRGWKGGWFARLPIPGENGRTAWRAEFATTTPGHNRDLFNVTLQDLKTPSSSEFRPYKDAFDLNVGRDRDDRIFYTSEQNDGRELTYCKDANYCPSCIKDYPTGASWHKWKLVPDENRIAPYWIFHVPKSIINGHGGIWSDNSIALLGALFRMQFPFTSTLPGGRPAPAAPIPVPPSPQVEDLERFILPLKNHLQ